MGTRALVHFKEGDFYSDTIVSMYRQMDGYPEGLGEDIHASLNHGDVTIINGISGEGCPAAFNGMGCLAAWLIGELKGGTIGSIYLYPPDTEDVGEEYNYTLYKGDDSTVWMHVENAYDGEVLGDGPLKNFDASGTPLFLVEGSIDRTYEVASDSVSGKTYTVTHVTEKWTCDCMDHLMRHRDCKHIRQRQIS